MNTFLIMCKYLISFREDAYQVLLDAYQVLLDRKKKQKPKGHPKGHKKRRKERGQEGCQVLPTAA